MRLYLTPAAVGYLTQFLLAILISGYLLWLVRTPHHPRHARWLIGFFICIALFIATLFFEVTLLPTQRLRVVYVQNTALGVALVFLIQFAYRFPVLAPARRWEARVALALSSLYTLWEAAYALYRFLRLGYGEVVYRPNWSDYLLLAVLLWTPLAFLRQLYILEHPTGGRWRRFISPLLHPSNRTARTVRDFTLVFLFVASLNVFNILRASYLVTVSLANMGISLGILLALFAFAMIYLNGHPETTSFIVKLAGVVLTLMLAVLGIVAWVVAPFYIAEYEPALPRRQTLRFVPNALGGYDISAHPLTYESDLGSPLILTEGLPYQKEYVALCSEPLGFRFPFYGQTYQQIYVCNDGALGIGQALEPRNYQYRFGAGRPLIMALFIDLHPDISPEGVYVRLEPERLLVTWRQQRAFRDPEQSYTFQAALYKDGVFELSYRDLPATFTYQPNDAPEANPWAIGALPGGPGHITPDLWRSEALPFSGGPEGVVQDYLLAFRQRLHNVLAPLAWLILGASAIIVIGLPLLIYTGLVQPLNALLRGVQRIEAGEYHTQVPVRYTDEIGFLTQAFNHLAAELDALIHGLETQVAIRTATLDEVNAQLRAEIAQREELITELQTFSHTVAHDLKTPLSIIGGYSYLISEDLSGKGETRLAGFAGQVVHTIEKMGRIIDSILSFANVRQAEVTLRRIDMQAIVDEVLLDLHPLIAEVGAHPDYPEEWPAALGHPQWVAQIWSNYLSNALKYGICTGEAPPVIELGYVCCPAGVYRFWVRDHGPGLSQEQQAALFTPFRRVHKGPNEGTGLGLSIVKRMVEKMGGQVGVDSAPGEGSRFWFTLLPDTGDVDTLSSLPAVVVPETTLVHRLARFQETTLSQLADAARDTEFTVLQELIAQITQVDAVAGCALGDLLNNFDYEILLTLALNARAHPAANTPDLSAAQSE